MYIDYSKLWKLLIDKNMSKTDLMELTGISSRVMAKLSKNETVTTDTVARICAAMGCDVGDVMECVSEKRLTVYGCYRKYGKCVDENELYKTFEFNVGDRPYTVYISTQAAKKTTHILCESDGAIYWEQYYVTGTVATERVRHTLIKPPRDGDKTRIVVIKGTPGVITGLDENGFASVRRSAVSPDDVYVMSEAAFKLFNHDEQK